MEPKKPKMLPVVFLLGTTGVGKSKLSLDLAERLNGEIVNADSMQVYGGNLGVMTAKPTMEERARVPHHLYDVVDMHTKDFNVNKYLSLALPAIADIHSRHKLPIVVGGTNYYIEGLLFDKPQPEAPPDWEAFHLGISQAQADLPSDFTELLADFDEHIPLDKKSAIEAKYSSQPDTLHALLTLVDPKLGEYLHTRDTRRVINALVRHFKNSPGEGQMVVRYYPVMVWLRASPGVLEDRIGRRIGQMIGEQGGLDEIISLFDAHHATSAEPLDFEKGLLQAIGYKEFYPYYLLLKSGVPPTEGDLQQAKTRLQQKTIEYTKYQIKWLEKRIGRAFAGDSRLLLRVELDDPKEYESKALTRALEHF